MATMRKRFSTIALLWGMCLSVVVAQNSKLKKAKQYQEAFNYAQAIETYLQVIEKHDHPEAKIQLADIYRKINNYKEAEKWYAQVVELPEAEPPHYFYYGLMLQRNGDCKAAEDAYQKFLKLRPYDARRPYLRNACAYQDELLGKLSPEFAPLAYTRCAYFAQLDDVITPEEQEILDSLTKLYQ